MGLPCSARSTCLAATWSGSTRWTCRTTSPTSWSSAAAWRGCAAPWASPQPHRVLVVTKEEVRESNSAYAQGGIAGVLDPEDHFEDHIADTLAAGKGLCDPEVVAWSSARRPRRISELIAWGTHFDKVNGQVALTREGGHSHARIVHALGDATGREVMRAVIQQARDQRNIRIWQNSFTIDLLDPRGAVPGALVWDSRRGPSLIWARAVLLATGGAGQLYPRVDQPADRHGRRPRPGLSRGGRAPRHGVHAVPPDGPLHRRLGPPPLDRGAPGRGGLPPRPQRPPVHARLPSPGRARPARRRLPRHHRADGQDPAPERLPRPLAPRRGLHPRIASPASTSSAAASTSTSPATRSPSAPAPTT